MRTMNQPRALLLAAVVLALGACASAPPAPVDAIQAAEIAISNADKENAAEFAPLEMRSAREKLAAARVAPTDDDSAANSRRLADEARADAELATARAAAAKASAVNEDLKKSNQTLRQETQRARGE